MDRYYKKRFVPLALPALLLFVMVIVIPLIMGVIYSFTAWRGTYFAGGDHFWEAFVGFDNYVKAFKTKKEQSQGSICNCCQREGCAAVLKPSRGA